MTHNLPDRANNSNHAESDYNLLDYSETILHRLRPRVQPQGASQIIRRLRAPLTRRKRTRPSVKRCSICRTKRLYRLSDRENPTSKTVRDVRSRVIFLSKTESPVTRADLRCDGLTRNSASLIQSVGSYIASILREGKRWATRCLFGTLKFGGRTEGRTGSLSRDGIRQTAGPSPLQIIQARRRDFRGEKDKTRKRRKSKSHRGCDGSGCSTAVLREPGPTAGNLPEEVNLGDLPVSDEKQPRFGAANVSPVRRANDRTGNCRSKRRKLRSPSRRIRRKRARCEPRTGCCSSRFDIRVYEAPGYRYKKVTKKDLHPHPRESRVPTIPKKSARSVLGNSFKNTRKKADNFLSSKSNKLEVCEERNGVGDESNDQKTVKICFGGSMPLGNDRIKLGNRDKLSETSTEDFGVKNGEMDLSRTRDEGCNAPF